MNRSFLVVGIILSAAMPTGASAQGTRPCSSSSMSTFGDWVAIASGVTCATNDASLTGLSASVSFYVSGPWDPVGFVPPAPPPTQNTNTNGNTNTTNTPNLGCAPYVRMPWDPPGPPPAPCNDNSDDDNTDTNTSGGDEDPPSTQTDDEQDLNTLVNQANATPEPATLLLVASGLGGIGALARRRKARASNES